MLTRKLSNEYANQPRPQNKQQEFINVSVSSTTHRKDHVDASVPLPREMMAKNIYETLSLLI